MPINHAAIIAQYKTDPDAHRKMQQDAVARVDQSARLNRAAAWMRGELASLDSDAPASRKTSYTASATRCITPCKKCGSHNTHTAKNGVFYCFDCRSIDGVKVSMPALVCPKCESTNFFINPKNGDMHCYGCRKDSRGVGPKGRSKYTHYCVCGSGQVDVSATHIICRTCGKRARK